MIALACRVHSREWNNGPHRKAPHDGNGEGGGKARNEQQQGARGHEGERDEKYGANPHAGAPEPEHQAQDDTAGEASGDQNALLERA
jgi:hypothetical protein